MRILLFFLAFCLSGGVLANQAAEVYISTPVAEGGGSPVNPGDVYGEARFELQIPAGWDIQRVLLGFASAVVGNTYGNSEGSYLFTIEVRQGGELKAVQPIVSVNVKEERLLFWTTSSVASRDVSFNGVLLTTGPVTAQNNELQVSFNSYFKRTSSFDLTLVDGLNRLLQDFGILRTADTSGAGIAILGAASKLLVAVLAGSEETTEHFRYTMHLAQLNSVVHSRVRSLHVPINFAIGGERGGFTVFVKAWSVSSRYMFDTTTHLFERPSASTILNQSLVAGPEGSVRVIDLALSAAPDAVRSFLRAIVEGTAPEGAPMAYQRCSQLLSYYSSFLSNRDALAVLWATLSEYRDGVKAAGGAACVSGRRTEFDQLGLPTEELLTYLNQ